MTRGTKRIQAIEQLEANDLKRSSESIARSLNMEPVEPELSFEVSITFVYRLFGGAFLLFVLLNCVFLGTVA
jgi:hypothetical protein